MPTTRPRHVVTETDDIADALDRAQRRMPDASRSEVIRRLVLVGATTLDNEAEDRLALVKRHAGHFSGMFPPGALEELRQDWPE